MILSYHKKTFPFHSLKLMIDTVNMNIKNIKINDSKLFTFYNNTIRMDFILKS